MKKIPYKAVQMPEDELLIREALEGFFRFYEEKGTLDHKERDLNRPQIKNIVISDTSFGVMYDSEELGKIRIYSVTEGPGKHIAPTGIGSSEVKEYEVPGNHVYATIDTLALMTGSWSTYMFSRDETGKLKFENSDRYQVA